MRPKSIKICPRCGQQLPREAFAMHQRTDSPTLRPDSMCRSCRATFDEERSKRYRVNTTILCACGCGKPTRVAQKDWPEKGHVKGQPMKYLLGHASRTTPHPGRQYIVDENGCWIWQLKLDRDGYGCISRGHKSQRAARVYYEERYGPLPPGYVPDHQCPGGPNRACVNPDHLVAVPVAENSRWKKSTKLDWEKVRQIRELAKTLEQDEIAARFGIGQAHVSRIVNGNAWREEDDHAHTVPPVTGAAS